MDNETAKRLKQAIEAEQAAKDQRKVAAEASKNRMMLDDTLKITGKTRPGFIAMTLRAVFWQRDEDE